MSRQRHAQAVRDRVAQLEVAVRALGGDPTEPSGWDSIVEAAGVGDG